MQDYSLFLTDVLRFIFHHIYSNEEQPIKMNVRHIKQGPYTHVYGMGRGEVS